MPDLAHLWGSDLSLSPTGDIATADTPLVTQQRVLRRLLTNPGDDIWSPEYGAGLSRFIGQPGSIPGIRAAIRGQIFKEAAVSHMPEPAIDVAATAAGRFYVHVRYADAATGGTQTLSFTA